MAKKPKTKKKKKQTKLSTIRSRLLKLWSVAVRERVDIQCEFCGIKNKEINKNGKKTKIDAHHFLSKKIKDCPLKFEILNGIATCPFCHKFGVPSFHRDPINTITWLIKNHPERYEYVLNNSHHRVDLENRKILEEIEICLRNKTSLNIEKLKQIESEFPRRKKKKFEITGSLFDTDSESSSSSD